MPQSCKVCRSQHRAEIDAALLKGQPFRSIAARTGTSTGSLVRHKNNCIPSTLAAAKQTKDADYGTSVFERLQSINRETAAILAEARAASTPVIALAAISRIEGQLTLEAKLLGQLNEASRVAVGININSPDSRATGLVKDALGKATPEQLHQFSELLTAMARERPEPTSCGLRASSPSA